MKLHKEEIVTMDILRRQGQSNQANAKRLGITEGTVRHHLKRMGQNAKDGRSKCSLIEQLDLVEAVDSGGRNSSRVYPKIARLMQQSFERICRTTIDIQLLHLQTNAPMDYLPEQPSRMVAKKWNLPQKSL